MIKLSIGQKVAAGFAGALAVLLFSVVASHRSTTALIQTAHWVDHTHRGIQALEELLSHVKDIETAARGYVITGEERYLEPLLPALEAYPTRLIRLRELTAGNSDQQRRLDDLEPLVAARVGLSREIIALRKDGKLGEAQDRVVSGDGRLLMDGIRRKVRELQQTEQELLYVRSREADESARTAIQREVFLCALAFLLVGLAGCLIHRDIAGRKQAEKALRSSETRLGRIVETIADGIFILDHKGQVVFANSRAEGMFGLSRQVMAGRTHDDTAWKITTVDGKPYPAEELPFALAMRKGVAVYDVELAVERADGSRMCLSVNAAPLVDPSGAITGVVASACDTTRRKEVERMKEQFVSTVSHELRTPLSSLRGFAELMLSREFPREKQREFLKIVHDESVRLTNLINDFLDIQRMESGHQTYAFERVEPRALLERALALFEAGRGKNELRLDVPEGLPRISADPDRLRQVLSNLLSNAIKFSPQGGEVVLGARREGEKIVVWVSDQGIGIPSELQPRLFEKFFRVDDDDTRSIGGTGLGLAVVNEIVQAHQGRVWVESEPGKGSRFSLALPIPAEPAALLPSARAPREGATDILLVEDDRAFALLLTERFQLEGLSVSIAPTGEEALVMARSRPPALGIVDIQLDGRMDGWELLVQMKDDPSLRTLPILILSATDSVNSRGLAVAGADYVLKPISPEWVLETVKHHLPAATCKRVLVVDDDKSFRRQVVECLAVEGGLEVVEAADGREALSILERGMPDLLLLDLLMPEIDGFEVLRRLRSDHRAVNLPVVVITAKQLQPEERAYIKRRMAGLVRKREASLDHIVRTVMQMLPARAASPPAGVA